MSKLCFNSIEDTMNKIEDLKKLVVVTSAFTEIYNKHITRNFSRSNTILKSNYENYLLNKKRNSEFLTPDEEKRSAYLEKFLKDKDFREQELNKV